MRVMPNMCDNQSEVTGVPAASEMCSARAQCCLRMSCHSLPSLDLLETTAAATVQPLRTLHTSDARLLLHIWLFDEDVWSPGRITASF